MIKSLKIKNFALIDSLETEFYNGLNIITGETGSGKSILIDALGLILGERANSDSIRTGEEKSIVEGVFEIEKNQSIKNFLKQNEIDESQELILRREITSKGTSRCFINDSPVSLNTLKSLGELLVDLHGQHDHQSLLNQETHIDFLDDFASNQKILKKYEDEFSKFSAIINKRNELIRIENELNQKKELLSFQLNEINAVNPIENEEEELEREKKIGEHSEKINQLATEIYSLLSESENSVESNLSVVKKRISEISKIDESFKEDEIDSAIAIIKELIYEFEKLKNREEFSNERLEEIRNRLGAISMLKKKFGGSILSVIEFKNKISNELNLAENFKEELEKLNREIIVQRKVIQDLTDEIFEKRKSFAKKLEKEIIQSLSELGIQNGKFSVSFSEFEKEENSDSEFFILRNKKRIKVNKNGGESVEFFISANLGEEPKKLTLVASGGEVSRIMLSLKSALANSDRIPVLIFDEIDTGISGRIGFAVGKKLLNLSKSHQVISITHLPQIAALGENHFVVEKFENKNSTSTKLKKINQSERILEIAKLLSGDKITDASIKSAKELIAQV